MANILLIETATETCSVAIAVDGKVVACRETTEGYRHSEKLTLFISNLFSETAVGAEQLHAVCTSRGPGSYTGLRIGVSAAKGLCYGLGIPLIAVSTLHAQAHYISVCGRERGVEITTDTLLCPMTDARRMEVYTAMYDHSGNPVTDITAMIIKPESFAEQLDRHPVWFFGNGADKCKEVISHSNAHFLKEFHASARFMSSLAESRYANQEFENVAYFEPYYLKDFVATIPRNKI